MNLRQQLEQVASATPPSGRRGAVLYHGARVALAVVLAGMTYLLFPASPAVDYPLYEIGSVAGENVIAPFAYTVRKSDAQLRDERDEVTRAVEPVFVYVPAALDSARGELARYMEALRAVAVGGDRRQVAQAIQQRSAELGITLEIDEAAYLANPTRRVALEGAIARVFTRWLAAGVATNGDVDELRGGVRLRRGNGERRTSVDSIPAFSGLLARARLLHPDPGSEVADALFVKLITTFFHPTVVPDNVATERAREELRRAIPAHKYEVRAGEKIVGAHEVVGREEYEKLRALHDELRSQRGGERVVGRVVGAVLFNFLVVAIFGVALVLFRPALYRTFRALSFVALTFILVLVAGWGVAQLPIVHPEQLIPVALAAVIFSVLFDPRISMVAAMILAVLVGGQSVFRGTNAVFINLIGGAAAAFSVRALRRRNQAWNSILIIGSAYLLAATAIGLTLGWDVQEIARSAGWGVVNALVSVPIAMLLLPLAEEFTGIDTDLKLLEWSDLNRPLMRRLSLEAPGTYAHTMAMANLAEAACNAIGANGLLARVGAYYHDIGKLKKPQYFVENQPKGRNPHDKLKPNTSAAIIRNHVREGIELADEFRLPKAIRAFIAEHHGTGQIAYFLEKARERDGVVNPGEFCYPGPVPQSAETAVVMLADGVEAATRVLQDPTPQKLRDVIDHIVRMRTEQGQLRDAPLTLKQLDQVKEQFARVLIGMYHNRIDYPTASGGVTAEFAPV